MNTCRRFFAMPMRFYLVGIVLQIAAAPVLASTFSAYATTESESESTNGGEAATGHIVPGETGLAVGYASGGQVGAAVLAAVSLTDSPQFQTTSTAGATMLITGVLLGGPSGGYVTTSYNLQLTGSLSTDGLVAGTAGFANSAALMRFESSLYGDNVPAIYSNGAVSESFGQSTGGAATRTRENTGFFSTTGFDGDAIVTSTAGSLPVGVPLTFNVGLNVSAFAYVSMGPTGAGSLAASSGSSFERTLSFPKEGPVFNLPAGYTANSADGFIVDNRWSPSPVPVGPTWALLGTGLLSLLPRLRRRCRERKI